MIKLLGPHKWNEVFRQVLQTVSRVSVDNVTTLDTLSEFTCSSHGEKVAKRINRNW